MPRYDYCCDYCGVIQDVYARIDEEVIECPQCGTMTHRKFSPPTSKPICDIEPYWDEHISKNGQPTYVESRRHKEQLLKQNGLKMKRGLSDYR